MNVYPKITDDVTRRGILAHKFTIHVSRAEQVNAEMTERARAQHGGATFNGTGLPSGRPPLQANFTKLGGKVKNARQRGGKYGGNRSRSVSSASSSNSTSSNVAKKKQNACCKLCGKKDHWKDDKECGGVPQQASGNNEEGRMQSFSGGVFLKS
ncbi:unnamed protein product [Phytophthora fragariaefolia]|uniref:Unnamed protein product n=1 Tax=Phytophthora fragariaefolia TaxID=1490495 RepID=A0A9W6YPA4_9STRA|nr:unnamed protein product [Phytophthora fragariaefolia]